jgi:lipopolysaccharide/colanic/teichoic acid biosynthesis glycosyltransferase
VTTHAPTDRYQFFSSDGDDQNETDPHVVDLEIVERPLSVVYSRRCGTYERFCKRPVDLIGSAGLLVALSPVIAAVGIGVQTILGRPVLFRQARIARGGTTFEMLKFRSMHPPSPNEPSLDEPHTSEDSPRVPSFGRFIRDTSLDELPQLVNVLRGEMSLIGPRPEMLSVAQSHELIDHPRHLVRPGITGSWQVSDKRSGFVHDHVSMDIEYIENVTLRNDMTIAARTVAQIVRAILGSIFTSRRRSARAERSHAADSADVAA